MKTTNKNATKTTKTKQNPTKLVVRTGMQAGWIGGGAKPIG
jgi:hypothetical protein